jgi:hypothetical protein
LPVKENAMRMLASSFVAAFLVIAAHLSPVDVASAAVAPEFAACDARRAVVAKKAEAFVGTERIRRLIEADIRRAGQELAEGDADECTEALDHAEKLLSGNY